MRKWILALALAIPLILRADTVPTYETQTANFSAPADRNQWHVKVRQGQNGFVLPFVAMNGTNDLNLTGYTVKLAMRKPTGIDAARLTGTVSGNEISFVVTSNFLAKAVDSWILRVTAEKSGVVVNQAGGLISIDPSPELDSGDLVMTRRINIDNYTWINQFPTSNLPAAALFDDADALAALSNTVALAEGAVQPGDAVSDLSNDAGYLTEEADTNALAVIAALTNTIDTAVQPTDEAYTNTVALAAGAVQDEVDPISLLTDKLYHYGDADIEITPASEFGFSAGTITSYSGTNATVVIPYEIGGVAVTAIGDLAFSPEHAGTPSLVTLIGPKSVTSIGFGAFDSCYNFESASFPSVTSIGDFVFSSCPNLASITFAGDQPTEGIGTYVDSYNVTNYVTSPTATGWGATLGGRPVVRLGLTADTLTVGTTNVMTEIGTKVSTNDAAYLAALTNVTGTGGVAITGTGRSRAIDGSAFVQTEADTNALAVIASHTNLTGAADAHGLSNTVALAAGAVQAGDAVSDLSNDAGYITAEADTNALAVIAALTNSIDTAVQPTDEAYTNTVALAAGAVQDEVDPRALKLNHYGDPDITITPASEFGFDAGTGTITSYSGTVATVVIPYEIGGVAVTAIGAYAFSPGGNGTPSLGTLIAPKSVTSIGDYAFNVCLALTNITFAGDQPTEGGTLFFDSYNVTNYVTSPTATGWGATFGGRPVVRLGLTADTITLGTDTITEWPGGVSQRWDYVYAESVGLCVGPNQPSSYIANLVYGSVTQQVEFLAFDDTTREYTGAQTWQTWPTWNSNVVVRGSSWYADATPGDVTWTLHYVGDGLTASSTNLTYTGIASSTTNLQHWAVSATLSGITAGDTITYWISRDPADGNTGDNYLRKIAIGFNQ